MPHPPPQEEQVPVPERLATRGLDSVEEQDEYDQDQRVHVLNQGPQFLNKNKIWFKFVIRYS